MSEAPLLESYQRRIAAGAITAISVAAIGLVVFGVFWLLRLFVLTFAKVIWPLAVASILAVLLRPVVDVFGARLRLGRVGGVVALYTLVVLALGAVAFFLIPALIAQVINIVELTPMLLERATGMLVLAYPELGDRLGEGGGLGARILETFVPELREGEDLVAASGSALQHLQTVVLRVIGFATGLAIIPVYLFFMLSGAPSRGEELEQHLSFLRPRWREDIMFLTKEFGSAMVVFFRGQILIGVIMGALLAVGFSVAGLRFGLVFGLLLGILNIIPYLGTILGLATALPVAYLQPEGGLALVGITLGIFAAVQVLEGYVLTPWIMGGATGLHPMVIIVAIFFWGTALNGILGMVLAIPLTAFGVVAWQLVRRRYLTPLILGSATDMRVAETLDSAAPASDG